MRSRLFVVTAAFVLAVAAVATAWVLTDASAPHLTRGAGTAAALPAPDGGRMGTGQGRTAPGGTAGTGARTAGTGDGAFAGAAEQAIGSRCTTADPAARSLAADAGDNEDGDGWETPISSEGDVDADGRATYAELAARYDGERPENPMVVHWVLETAGSPVVDAEEVACVAAAAYADPRGWNLDGAIRFERVDDAADADFVLVVAEADLVPEYSDSCLSGWTGRPDASCTVGNYVIINDERWRDGALGDPIPLAQFRIHELNHETGHWLGQGHFSCQGGTGAVNQQQFRALQGCTANAWPLPFERAMVAARFGLWPSLGGAYEPYGELGWATEYGDWSSWIDDTSGATSPTDAADEPPVGEHVDAALG